MYCLDASVVANSFIEKEQFHESSKRLIDKIKREKLSVILPELVLPEVASAISRGLGDSKKALAFVDALRDVPNFTFIPIDDEISNLASKFAAKNKLRGCDSIYVAVAYLFNVRLITLDNQQKERAAGIVEVLAPKEEFEKR